MQQVEAFWDSVADVYDACNERVSESHHQRFTEAVKYLDLNPGNRILNIWSRTGTANKFLRTKEASLEIINAELSSKMIAIAKRKFPDERFDKVDLLNLPYPCEHFDEILSLETIEHVQYPLVFLRELYRVLKRGGKLLLSAPPSAVEIEYRIYNSLFVNHGEGAHRFIGSRTMKKMLQEVDFTLNVHKATMLIPAGPKFLRDLGEKVISRFQNTCISEFGIRHFYLSTK